MLLLWEDACWTYDVSSMYSYRRPCSTGTHDETVKKAEPIFCIHQLIIMESRPRISNLFQMFTVLQSNRKFHHIYLTVNIVIHKSRNLIGTLGSSEFGPR